MIKNFLSKCFFYAKRLCPWFEFWKRIIKKYFCRLESLQSLYSSLGRTVHLELLLERNVFIMPLANQVIVR